ncbi:hypothetical protein SCAR479_01482 [Seiridium cardinale]|uniref:Apple domain-containing protein n=1 Tax=Seiridium cardinale TaxID=138064 RepID=A0ABR2Y5W8_9PEZI
MAYEQPYRQQYPYGQQQGGAGYGNWNEQGAQSQPPPAAGYAEWDNTSHPLVVPQWYQPPSAATAEGIDRAHQWVANHHAVDMSPPPTTKTPFTDYSTEGGATVGAYPFYSAKAVQSLPPPPQKPVDRICGVKRSVFLIIMAIGAFVLVVGIATGLGVGLALSRNSATTATAPAQTRPSSSPTPTKPTQTTTTSATTTKVSPTPSFTGTVASGPIDCPSDNGTVYISKITSKPFNIECGHDYNSKDGAKDLSHQATNTMADCVDICGSKSTCVGVGWGVYQGIPTCWLKSALGEPNDSKNWYFARLQSLD